MKLLAQWLSSAVVDVAITLISAPRPAFADSYTIYDLGDSNARNVFGMDTTGDVVIFQESCGKFGPSCYMTYTNGLVTNESSNRARSHLRRWNALQLDSNGLQCIEEKPAITA